MRLILRSGFFSFQAAISASVMPELPPVRSHISMSCAAAGSATAASSTASAARDPNFGKRMFILPCSRAGFPAAEKARADGLSA